MGVVTLRRTKKMNGLVNADLAGYRRLVLLNANGEGLKHDCLGH